MCKPGEVVMVQQEVRKVKIVRMWGVTANSEKKEKVKKGKNKEMELYLIPNK